MNRRLDAVIRRGYVGIPLRGSSWSLNQGGTAKLYVSPLTKYIHLVKGVFLFSD